MWLRTILPAHHLDAETKDVVKLGVGLIGTMAALLLGLLVASAKSSFDARSSELTQMAANTHPVGPRARPLRTRNRRSQGHA